MSKFSTKRTICTCAYITEHHGYVKRSKGNDEICTVDLVMDTLFELDLFDESEVKQRVADWMKYISDETKQTKYFHDVRKAITGQMIDESNIALIASSFASMDRDMVNRNSSEFIGSEGSEVFFEFRDHILVKTGTSKYGKTWFLYRLHDTNNNVITWFADKDYDRELTTYSKIKALVIKHTTFNGVKQTSIKDVSFSI